MLAGYSLIHLPVDIRTEKMLQTGVIALIVEKGRAILAAAMEAHGGQERWKAHGVAAVTMTENKVNLEESKS